MRLRACVVVVRPQWSPRCNHLGDLGVGPVDELDGAASMEPRCNHLGDGAAGLHPRPHAAVASMEPRCNHLGDPAPCGSG